MSDEVRSATAGIRGTKRRVASALDTNPQQEQDDSHQPDEQQEQQDDQVHGRPTTKRRPLPAPLYSFYTCSICHDFLCDPVRLECGHVFCHKDIATAYAFKKECPECRAPTNMRNWQTDLRINEALEQLAPGSVRRELAPDYDCPLFQNVRGHFDLVNKYDVTEILYDGQPYPCNADALATARLTLCASHGALSLIPHLMFADITSHGQLLVVPERLNTYTIKITTSGGRKMAFVFCRRAVNKTAICYCECTAAAASATTTVAREMAAPAQTGAADT